MLIDRGGSPTSLGESSGYLGVVVRWPRVILIGLYVTAFIAVIMAVNVQPETLAVRLVMASCGLIDAVLAGSIAFNVGGVADAIRHHGLVKWIKPPWISRGWAEQPRNFSRLARLFGAIYIAFGLLVAFYAG